MTSRSAWAGAAGASAGRSGFYHSRSPPRIPRPRRPTSTPDKHLRQGAAIAEIDGGIGQFANASGRITSNFVLSDTGEVTDHQLGLVFVEPDLPDG